MSNWILYEKRLFTIQDNDTHAHRRFRPDPFFFSFQSFDGLVKSQNLKLLPQLVGIVKVVNTQYIVATKISPDFLRDHQSFNSL